MKEYIESLNILSPDELSKIDNCLISKIVSKGEVLLQENEVCKDLYYVQSGALRSYYTNEKADDITYCIAFENELICSFSSFILQKPSQEIIHVLLDSFIQIIDYNSLQELYESSINWQKVGRIMMEKQYVIMEQHITKFQEHGGYDRYRYLLDNYPKQLNMIPQHYIASYLGISTRHLTRIRKSIL